MKKITYPYVAHVSMSKGFIQDPYARENKVQVCIGKLKGKFVCVETRSEDTQWMLKQIRLGVKSGAISGLVLGFWNYARAVSEQEFNSIKI